VDRILRSPLPIKRFFKNAVTRPRNAASLAVRQRRTIKAGAAAVVVTVQLLRMELLLSVQVAGSQRQCRLSRAVTARCFAGTATRRAKAAAAAVDADAERLLNG
jgi:hypothetical protein